MPLCEYWRETKSAVGGMNEGGLALEVPVVWDEGFYVDAEGDGVADAKKAAARQEKSGKREDGDDGDCGSSR